MMLRVSMKRKTKWWWWERKEIYCVQMEVELSIEIMQVLGPFKQQGSCFSEEAGPHDYVKLRVSEELNTYGASNMMFNIKNISTLGNALSSSNSTDIGKPRQTCNMPLFEILAFWCSSRFIQNY